MRRSLPSPDYDVLIDGFPRSANTYVEMMFRLTQGEQFSLGHHAHHPITIIEAVRAGRKTILVIRKPDDAVISWGTSWGVSDVDGLANIFDIYINYYRAVMPVLSNVAVFEFDEVTADFRGLLRGLQETWQCRLNTDFDEKAVSQTAFKEIDARIVSEDGELTEMRVNRPSLQRALAKPQMLALLSSPRLTHLRDKAQIVFRQMLALRSLGRLRVASPSHCLLSIVPDDDFGRGHLHGYHRTLEEVCRRNKWSHAIACRREVGDGFDGLNVLPLLRTWSSIQRQSELVRWPQFFRLTKSIKRCFDSLEASAPAMRLIIFIESFTIRKLLAVATAALFARHDVQFWVLFRYGYEGKNLEKRLVALICSIYGLLRPGSIRLFSDSALVAKRLQAAVGREVTVLPIPTVGDLTPDKVAHRNGQQLHVVWPGTPLQTKGADVITRLLRAPAPPGVAVVLQCKAHAGLAQRPGGPALEILPDHINQKDHLAVLARADAVILPYDARSYSSRTSGLLVEAIHCGTMPFVSAPTWLSNELEQLGLPELIVDWSRADVWSYIDRCVRNESLRHRFTEARRRYQRYHSVETYAAVLKLTVREVESAPYAS